MKSQKRLILPDLHIPFQDKKLLACWLRRLETQKFDGVDIIGDMLDCYTLSRFDKNPTRKGTFQKEVDIARDLLSYIRSLVGNKAEIKFSEGNHESRLRKVLWGKSPELADIRNLSIPSLLGLSDLGIDWHDIHTPYKIEDVWFSHGDILRKHAGMSARAKSDVVHGSIIIGHCHRMGWSPFTSWDSVEDAYEVGHMSDYTQLDYVQTCPNWQLGWAEAFFAEGVHWVNFYRVIHKGRMALIVGPEGIIDSYRRTR